MSLTKPVTFTDWIPFTPNGTQPVANDTLVWIRTKSGYERDGFAHNLNWHKDRPIIAYAIEKNLWHKWEGGKCPVPGDWKVRIRTRNAYTNPDTRKAKEWMWDHSQCSSDLVEYMVVSEAEAIGPPPATPLRASLTPPEDCEVACVEFTPGGNQYYYWVPRRWKTMCNDKLIVRVGIYDKTVKVLNVKTYNISARPLKLAKDVAYASSARTTTGRFTGMTPTHMIVDDLIPYPEPWYLINPLTTSHKAKAMQPIKVTTQTILNGGNFKNVDAADLSNDQIFQTIADIEGEIDRLEKIKSQPKKLQARIAELQASIALLTEIVDARP